MKKFKFSLVFHTRENTDVFITLDDNIYGIYIVKLGFTGDITILFFLFLLKNIDCGYMLELPLRAETRKISVLSKNYQFLEVKFSMYLNKCVFVMITNSLLYLS